MDLEALGVTRSFTSRRVPQSRPASAWPNEPGEAPATVSDQAALLRADVRALLDEALDCELGIHADDRQARISGMSTGE